MFNLLLLLTVVIDVQTQSNWFYDMDDDWEVSNKLKSVNPYYGRYKQAAEQMAMYGYAKHVGKINRGQYFNPELNMPANRALGYQSDFNPQDFNTGAFKYKPQGQKFRAKAVHVYEGLASYVGEVRTMPIGQHVQEDGTILVQTNYKGDPCRPNPCTNLRMSTCTAVNKFTAKCSRKEAYELTLTWTDPTDDFKSNDLDLLLVAGHHDGTLCAGVDDFLDFEDDEACGALFSEDDSTDYYYDVPNIAEESATLTTLSDGTKYQDYTYAVIVYNNNQYNPSEGRPMLTVKYNGVVKQTLAIPQYTAGGPNLNYAGSGSFRNYYFFGCFRPQLGFVDTRGAGFHDSTVDSGGATDTVVLNGLGIFSAGLCQATLRMASGYGFNPHKQSGSGDESYQGCFSTTSQVETLAGFKTLAEVSIGDFIRTSSGGLKTHFTEFIGWLDRQESTPVKMLQLWTSQNLSPLTLTGSHIVFTPTSTKYADELLPGDSLLHWNGTSMQEQQVTQILPTLEFGYWAPLTMDGTLLIDGYLSSCYASFPHQLAEIAMKPVKTLPSILLDNEESQHEDGVRGVVTIIKKVGELLGTRKQKRTDNGHVPIVGENIVASVMDKSEC